MLQPILTYMACGYMGRQVSFLRSAVLQGNYRLVDTVTCNKLRKLNYCHVKETLAVFQSHFTLVLKLESLPPLPLVEGEREFLYGHFDIPIKVPG